MFCTKCGFQVEDGVNFCPKCGHSADGQQAPITAARQSADGRKALMRADAKKSMLIMNVIFAVICLIMGIVIMALYSENAFNLRTRDMGGSVLFFAILMFAMMLVQLLKAVAISKSFVCVCEDCVYGVAGKAFYFTTQPFEVRFDQITAVGIGNAMIGNIKIDCGPNTYGCMIDNPEKIIRLIQKKMNQR